MLIQFIRKDGQRLNFNSAISQRWNEDKVMELSYPGHTRVRVLLSQQEFVDQTYDRSDNLLTIHAEWSFAS